MKLLNGLSRSEFLSKYWQKKPLCIQQAIPNFSTPVSQQHLTTLSQLSEVESRIITGSDIETWECHYGPFDHAFFTSLPDKNWTLLVQSVDHHIPAVARLLEQFDFIPNWRVDDIMISLASDGGSVGPHIDQYDVFLLQAEGQRHWQINDKDYTESDLIDHSELKLLSEFNSLQDWILEPGDMLYLPPGVAHYGIAKGDCITISIGFRAPTDQELLAAFADDLPLTQTPFFYTDPELSLQNHCGEIDKHHISYIHQMMINRIIDDETFQQWFGRFITDSRTRDEQINDDCSFEDFDILFKQHHILNRYGDIRISYIQQTDHLDLFIAGQHEQVPANLTEFIQYLSQHRQLEYDKITAMPEKAKVVEILFTMYQFGYFYFDESTLITD